jgi:hypothetical protein
MKGKVLVVVDVETNEHIFLATAFAPHIRVVSEVISAIFSSMDDEFFPHFYGLHEFEFYILVY